MDRSDYSHLYHDSHFCSLSGVLEAREHLKAREVNAREQRLLHRQDKQLQQARDSCNRRHSWELDNVRRDLFTILERTPTFDRSLRDEQRRMSDSVQSLAIHGYAAGVSNSRASRHRKKGVVDTFGTPLPSLYKSFPKRAGVHLSPISARKTLNTHKDNAASNLIKKQPMNRSENHGVKVFGMNTPTVCPASEDHYTLTKHAADKAVRHADAQRPNPVVTSTTPNHRHTRLADSNQNAFSSEPVTELPRQLTSLDSPLSGATDAVPASQGQRKAALLRRRSDHAIMAIVRMKTRHELRRLQADVATIGQAASTRNLLINTLSQSLTELSSLGPRNVPANKDTAAASRKWSFPGDQSPPAASMTSGHPSKGSWLSIPISLPDGVTTDAGNSSRDLAALRARPRFYSVD